MKQMDTTAFIGNEVKSIMLIVAEIDPDMPDEDIIEVLIGAVMTWGVIEAQLLLPALEVAFTEAEPVVDAARKRLNILNELQDSLHLGEGADGPFNALAHKYIDAVKYHLLVDIQDLVPLASQLSSSVSSELAHSMAAMKSELV